MLRTSLRHASCLAATFALIGFGAGHALASNDLSILDLDVSTVTWDEVGGQAGGDVSGFVLNSGSAAIPAGIVLLIFEDRNGNGVFDAGSDLEIDSVALPALAADQSYPFTQPITAGLAFRDSPISVRVDAGDVVVETDESNNMVRSNFDCTRTPATGPMDPVLQWRFEAPVGDPYPNHLNVTAAPAVADLDGDGMPEVVVGMTDLTAGTLSLTGILRVLNGEDGSLAFQVSHAFPGLQFNVNSSPAVGDIDGDGLPEIVACASSNTTLVCLEHDGTVKWISPISVEAVNWGAPAIADLDGDGAPEIVIGRQALLNDGTLLWGGVGGRGSQSTIGALSCPADVDLDAQPELVAGNTIYQPDGTMLAQAAAPDGWTAVADLDLDGRPEIVHVSNGQVRALDALTATIVWGPVAMPGSGGGGPPAVGDFDGDGYPEIAVSGRDRFVVFEPDGSVRWSTVINDLSSGYTSCSAFDFDADGMAEIIARDQYNVFVFAGTDGTVLLQQPLSSCTFIEYAFAADVDADGRAEILAGANNNCAIGTDRSLHVFESGADRWPDARRIWNQHAYHVGNVNEDGTIPTPEAPHWLAGYNGYRQGWLTLSPSPWGGLDLTASRLRLECGDASHVLTVRVGNAGQLGARPGVPVTFYAGDPSAGGTLLQTVNTQTAIVPGGWEDVSASFDVAYTPAGAIHAVVDDAGGLSGTEVECDEANNGVDRELLCDPPLSVREGARGPEGVTLEAARPNPFTGRTAVAFVTGRRTLARVEILDMEGRRVRTLVDGIAEAGRHTATWDGYDDGGRRVGPGVYFCRLAADGRTASTRIVRLD